MSYQLLMIFLTHGIQALQHLFYQRSVWTAIGMMLKNKSHLVTFHENILVSQWTFQFTLENMFQVLNLSRKI